MLKAGMTIAITTLSIITVALIFLSAAGLTAVDASVYPADVPVHSSDASVSPTGDEGIGTGSTNGAATGESGIGDGGIKGSPNQITDSADDIRSKMDQTLAEVNAVGAVDQAAQLLKSLPSAVLSLAPNILNNSSAENQPSLSTSSTWVWMGSYLPGSYYLIQAGIAGVMLVLMLCLAYFPFVKGEDWTGCRTEAEFDERCIKPLLKSWGFIYNYQKPCEIRRGSEEVRGRIDFYVYDENRPLTLFEDKLSINSAVELEDACDQARSYALQFRLSNYVIASKQGLRLYKFEVSGDTLIKNINPRRLTWWNKRGLKKRILKLRGHGKVQDKQN